MHLQRHHGSLCEHPWRSVHTRSQEEKIPTQTVQNQSQKEIAIGRKSFFFVIVFCIFNRNNDKNPQAIPLLTNQPLTNLIIPQSTSHKSETILLPPSFEPGPPRTAAHSLLH